MGARRAVAVSVTGDAALRDRQSMLFGFSLRSTAGATVDIYDNPSAATGTVLATAVIAAGGSETVIIPNGVSAATGLYIDTTAAVVGSVWVG